MGGLAMHYTLAQGVWPPSFVRLRVHTLVAHGCNAPDAQQLYTGMAPYLQRLSINLNRSAAETKNAVTRSQCA